MIAALGLAMGNFFASNVALASLLLLVGIGAASSVIPNIPLVVAMVPLVKQYAVGAGLAKPAAIEAGYGQMPVEVLPLFAAMCFGATLGGNASLLGASSNIVAGGICAQNGQPLTSNTKHHTDRPNNAAVLHLRMVIVRNTAVHSDIRQPSVHLRVLSQSYTPSSA